MQPFTGRGKLGPMALEVTDKDRDADQSGFQGSGVFGSLILDVKGDDSEDKLTLALLLGTPIAELFNLDVSVNAAINLEVILSIDSKQGLPTLSADLVFEWGWDYLGGFSSPRLSLNNISLDIGSLISQFVIPITERVSDTLRPFELFFNQLTQPIPELEEIGFGYGQDENGKAQHEPNILGVINLVNELEGRKAIDWSFIHAAKAGIELANLVSTTLNYSGEIALGSISGLAAGEVTWEAAKRQDISLEVEAAFTEITESSRGGSTDPERGGFVILDYIKDIENWAKLLQGEAATLFTYEMPLLDAMFSFDQVLGRFVAGPVPIAIKSFGSIKAIADIAFGFDTSGLQKAVLNDNPLLGFDGFYLADTDLSTGTEKPELIIDVEVGIRGGVDVKLAGGGAEGKITFLGEFDLNDPNSDGKLRTSELDELLRYDAVSGAALDVPEVLDLGSLNGLYNLFDIKAASDAVVSLYAFAGFGSVSKDWTQELFSYNLFNWDYEAPDPKPTLGHIEGTTLYVHSGSRAGSREFIDTIDRGEAFVLTGTGDALTLSYNGYSQVFDKEGITRVVADGGAGNDFFDASNLVGVTVSFKGGVGNDTLITGNGGGHVLRGNAGDDVLDASLSSGSGAELRGGHGNDRITGGIGG